MPARRAPPFTSSESDLEPATDTRVPEENLEDDDIDLALDVEGDFAIPDEEERVINVES